MASNENDSLNKLRKQIKDDDEDKDEVAAELIARFPSPVSEDLPPEKLHDVLPPVPEVKFERPKTQTARSKDEPIPDSTFRVGGGLVGGPASVRGMGQALTVGTTLVASIIVGAGLGWLFDKYVLHSPATPWGLIVGFLFGVASGFVNLVRVSNQINADDERSAKK